MNVNFIGLEIYRNIRVVGVVIDKVFFDYFALVPAQNNKVRQPVVGVKFHNVPNNRVTAYFHHRFGADRGFFP